MGNKFCCEENREIIPTPSNEKIKQAEEDVIDNAKSEKNNSKEKEKEDLNKKDNENGFNLDNNISKENCLDEIHNLKSSIFDNDNDNFNENEIDKFNFNDNDNFEEKDMDNDFKPLTSQRKEKLDISNNSKSNSFASERNVLKNKKKDKSKYRNDDNNKKDKKPKEIKNVINNNPNYKNSPLELTDFNNDKENEFYLINTSHYIGLKNANNNLIFMKNDKDIRVNSKNIVEIDKNRIININKGSKIINNNDYNIISNTQKTTSVNPNIVLTARSQNIPYGQKLSDKDITTKSIISQRENENNNNNNKKLKDFVNKYNLVENIHNNNYKIIEIYIKNQIRKIIKNYKIYKRKKGKNKPKTSTSNPKKLNNNINNNEIKPKNINNFEKKMNDISYDILNSGSCQTILNKEKNFCIKYFDNGSIYIGRIKNNKCNGIGKYISSKGDITQGFFKENFLDGYEIIERRRNNSVFEGQIEKNKFNGYGIEIFEDGSTYFGKYQNNEKSGIGSYDWGDGSQYQGNWKNGLPNGVGIFSDNKNSIYEGEWKKGKMNGIGLFRWGDGRKYLGYYKEDKREGFGIFFWSNPLKIYMGFWINGFQNGVGKIYTNFKEKYYLWEEGKIIKKLSNNKEYDSQIRKYCHYFKMTTDDLLTLFLDL